MPADHRPRAQPGDDLEAREVNLRRDISPEVIDPRFGHYPHAGVFEGPKASDSFAREGRLWGREIKDVFIGQIVPHGPSPESDPDYEDSRYWVREIYEASPPGHLFSQAPIWADDPNGELAEEEPPYLIRWVTASNLAEISLNDPNNETHSLASTGPTQDDEGNPIVPDDGQLVEVSRVLSVDGTARFLFNASTGGDTAFCVVVENPGLTAQVLEVKWVTPEILPTGTLRYVMSAEPEQVMIWPMQFGRHFKGFAVTPSFGTVREGHNVLEATRVGGVWYVKQTLRYTTMHPSPTIDASDCQPHTRLI